ncbi:MAG TPA: hypothetical protein VLF87_02120, partial [Patescibacteria group bacterium]|nr:hypothetical protein [Patescibacteria group bacterium]
TDQNGYDIGGFRNLTGKSVTHVDRSFTQDSLPGLLNGKTATLHIVSGNGTKIGGNHFTLTGVSASITCN